MKKVVDKVVFGFLILVSCISNAQSNAKQIVTEEKTFFAYINQTRLSKRFGIWTDLHLRTKDQFVNRLHQSLGRIGVTYYLTNDLRFTFAYCFAYNFPEEGFKAHRVEHRPWQQIFFKQEYHKVQTIQMLRLEERYIQNVVNDVATNDYSYKTRLRYSYMVLFPFTKNGIQPKSVFGVLNNEVFFNFGKNVIYNVFDQNRFFAGAGYQVNKASSVHLGYMNIYQQLDAGNKYTNSHCIRLFFYHNIDFRKEKS